MPEICIVLNDKILSSGTFKLYQKNLTLAKNPVSKVFDTGFLQLKQHIPDFIQFAVYNLATAYNFPEDIQRYQFFHYLLNSL